MSNQGGTSRKLHCEVRSVPPEVDTQCRCLVLHEHPATILFQPHSRKRGDIRVHKKKHLKISCMRTWQTFCFNNTREREGRYERSTSKGNDKSKSQNNPKIIPKPHRTGNDSGLLFNCASGALQTAEFMQGGVGKDARRVRVLGRGSSTQRLVCV